ncbi:MAG: NAD+ synthetase [Burkholderiaceae bacterium]|jgi:nickel and cobalt resistance protein CnrY|uniref:CnrY/NccY family anti-sigma factor n=2 Tax=Cupriavidus TaxID=106589 RepID=A0A132HU32_9BURK|nr:MULTISPECIES: CnrY/NccY family anti-sigma factor [Burkholderiaceae]PCH56563.1 MAG: NAD+ synthetase [Burkholderiaceae bacterium]AMR77960.1 NAD+ synthetase [Cupriavidus nantongensis]AOY97403.1 NAD+ synthetase [Cupriavidus sp. USMAA2-4]AOY97660.1 NAD+ synthetase [Cupriavidus sp. USMAA2-4]AOY97819.1 NAD+ synthetase [Cupriavidus sp. USMAA2-4]
MADIDEWLNSASRIIRKASSETDIAEIQRRIAAEPTQEVLVARHDVWRAVLCAAVAALVAYAAMDRVATSLVVRTGPTWVATPSAASPFGLLIGE